jgi:hypothetical protein
VAEKSWLDLLVNSTSELESPRRFYYWAGIAAISAIVKKNVWLNKFSYKLYPNVYVLLVSARTGLRKGQPVSDIKGIVERVNNTRIISGRNSVQGVIKDLSSQLTIIKPGEPPLICSDAQAFLCAPELDSFMVKDEQGLSILTDLYNTHENKDEWKNTLKSSPVESLKNPCITFLAASNEALLEGLIRDKDIEGGFIARTMIVHESRKQGSNSLMFRPSKLLPIEDLANDLKRLKGVKGEFTIPHEVRVAHDQWYTEMSKGNYSEDKTGTMERIQDHILKTAMSISLSKSNDLIISQETMDEATDSCMECVVGTRKTTMGVGRSDSAEAAGRVMKVLISAENYKVERSKLLRLLKNDVNVLMLNTVLDDMGDNGKCILETKRHDGKLYYKLKDDVAETYKNFKKEIN